MSNNFWECEKCLYKFNDNDHSVCLMCEVPFNDDAIKSYDSMIYSTFLEDHSSFVEIHKYNMIVYRNAIDINHQKLLIEDCNTKLNRIKMPGISLSIEKPGPTEGFSYNTGWAGGQKELVGNKPPQCLEMATSLHTSLIRDIGNDLHKINTQTDPILKIPTYFVSKGVWARIYDDFNGLGFHQDPKLLEWVFIISLGADVEFEYYGPNEDVNQAKKLVIHSGDAVYFNGAQLFHAITSIIPDTKPVWWQENYSRVGLQMRGETN